MSSVETRSDWADPGALGFAPLAGINIVFAGVFLHWWGSEAYVPLVAVVGFVGGICQLLTGLIGLQRDDACGGTLMAAFGMLFMWGPGMMLVLHKTGVAGALDPLFGAWNLFLGVLLATWSIALVTKPWFEFLIGPYGGLTLVAAGLHHVVGLDAVVPGVLFLGLFAWGMYMLAHSLGRMSGIAVPLGRPVSEIFGVGDGGAVARQPASGD
ncbi:MAG: GPR1/FUN34/YaaH family transporter [Haloarculaceae archaeon]